MAAVEVNPYEINLGDVEPEEYSSPSHAAKEVSQDRPHVPLHVADNGSSFETRTRQPSIDEYADAYKTTAAQPKAGPDASLGQYNCKRVFSSLCTRFGVSLFAVGLLWLTCLSIAAAIVRGIVIGPSIDQVFTEWEKAANLAFNERDSFVACVNRTINDCNVELDRRINDETVQVALTDQANLEVVVRAQLIQESCSGIYATRLISLSLWEQFIVDFKDKQRQILGFTTRPNGEPLFSLPVTKINAATCDNASTAIFTSLTVDQNSLGLQTQNLTQSFLGEYEGFYQALSAQAAARQQFDLDYLALQQRNLGNLSNQIIGSINPPFIPNFDLAVANLQPDFTSLVQCSSLESGCSGGLRDAYVNAQLRAEGGFDNLHNVYLANKLRSEQVFNDLNAQQLGLRSFTLKYGQLLANFDATLKSFKPPVVNGELGGLISGFPNPLPPFSLSLDNVDNINITGILNPDAILNAMNPSIGNLTAAAERKLDDMTQVAIDTRANLVAGFNASFQNGAAQLNALPEMNLFDDYNPPPVNLSASDAARAQAREDFLSSQSALLLGREEAVAVSNNDTNGNFAGLRQLNFGGFSKQSFATEPLSADGLDFNLILELATNFSKVFFVLDIIFRLYLSVRTFLKYWKESAIGLPSVDVRKWARFKGIPYRVILLRLLTSPLSLMLIVSGFAFVFTLAIISFYIPILTQFIHGCHDRVPVTASATAQFNGTFTTVLSRSTRSIFFDLAAAEGIGNVTERVQEYDASRADKCTDLTSQAINADGARADALNAQISKFEATAANLLAMSRCVQSDTWFQYGDNAFSTNVYREFFLQTNNSLITENRDISYAVPPTFVLGSAISCASGALNSSVLTPTSFNCTASIPLCSDICPNQPNLAVIDKSTHRAACYTEWLIHTSLSRGLLTIVTCVCWWISRVFIMAGVCRMMWRKLVPIGFTFLASCDRIGKPVGDFEKELETELNNTVARFERGAYVYYLLGLLMHIPYIALMVFLSTNLTYRDDRTD